MATKLNSAVSIEQLKRYLRQNGTSKAGEICDALKISQPSLSRLIAAIGNEIVKIGQARSAQYALKKQIGELENPIPVFEIDLQGKASHVADLTSIFPKGFVFKTTEKDLKEIVFSDLPYFLDDLRPAGFLGRLIPKQQPELALLGFPDDILNWTSEHTVKFLAQFGSNSVGNLIFGKSAFELYQKRKKNPVGQINTKERTKAYPKFAIEILKTGIPGSSAGGEQPKFFVTLNPEKIEAIVKFSPSRKESIGSRIADLLVCEHMALETLNKHSFAAAKSTFIETGNQIFLEIQRFDREILKGRRGLISLRALDLEFAGTLGSWSTIAISLCEKKIISHIDLNSILKIELFAKLIANSDRHAGNLSFYFSNFKLAGLAPVYDMLPMLYAPQQGQIITREFTPPLPNPIDQLLWDFALPAAIEFWQTVAESQKISAGFRKIAKENLKILKKINL